MLNRFGGAAVRRHRLPSKTRRELRSPHRTAASRHEAGIENAVAAVNREIPIEIHTLTAQVDESMTRERVLAALSAFFGGLARLATIGLYRTLGYLATERRPCRLVKITFGIRMALGATSRSILKLVMRNVTALLMGGILTGIGLPLAATRLLSALLFGVGAPSRSAGR